MIEILLLDIDDTLLDFSWAEDQAIHRTYRELGAEMTDEMYARYHVVNQLWWQAYERGEIDRESLLSARHRQMCEEYSLGFDPVRCEALYRKNLGIGHHFIPHAVEALEALRGRCRLFLASNGVAETQYTRLESAGIAPYFEGIFISEEAGAYKPMPEYFNYCFARIPGFRRDRAAIVGDSLTSDILGGIQAGIGTVWFNPNGKPGRPDIRPDHEIHDLLELPGLL